MEVPEYDGDCSIFNGLGGYCDSEENCLLDLEDPE